MVMAPVVGILWSLLLNVDLANWILRAEKLWDHKNGNPRIILSGGI
jgi:hypothetical protein